MTVPDDDDYPGGWFDRSWGAPVCEPERHKPTPIGELCMDCQQPIGVLDQGLTVPHIYLPKGQTSAAMRLAHIHIDCFLGKVVLPAPGEIS